MIVTYAQNFEDVMLARAFAGKTDGFYVDVGAADPENASVTKWFYDLGWHGINIEPGFASFRKLEAARLRDINLNCGAGSAAGELDFHEGDNDELNSFDRSVYAEGDPRLNAARRVPVRSLTDILDEHAPGTTIDFLKIDAEGWEREVLLGCDFTKYRPAVLVIEAISPGTQTRCDELWSDVLDAAGYEPVWFDGINLFYIPRERAELKRHFDRPPNAFDEFMHIEFARQAHRILYLENENRELRAPAAPSQSPAQVTAPAPGPMSPLPIPPLHLDLDARARMTASCTDCAGIPKVWNAGHVLTENGTRVQIMHNGLKVIADGYYGSWMTDLIGALRGHHEPQEEALFHEVIRHVGPAATMLELGGFWSYYSLWFLLGRDERRAVVVEPDPWNISVGRQNAALNQAKIQFEQACVGAEALDQVPFAAELSGQITIPQVSVPSLMQRHRIDVLDILHCDTQGAETAVVRSCEALFAEKRIRFGVFSTHSHHISGDPLTHQRCLAMLQDFGARILAEHDVNESYSGDGLIVAYAGAQDLRWSPPPMSRNRYSTSLFRNPLFDLAVRLGQQ